MEKELQVVMRDAASLRRDITRMGLTNCQKKALESSAVFQETELGSFVEESEAVGLDTSLLAQVHNKPTGETWGGGGSWTLAETYEEENTSSRALATELIRV